MTATAPASAQLLTDVLNVRLKGREPMEVLGVKFVPLYVPLHRRLQTLAVTAWFLTIVFGGVVALAVMVYMLLFTRLGFLSVLYYLWIWIDKETCNHGGRRSRWVRRWAWWRYFRDYFPLRLVKTVDLDPTRNYLLCVFPHGVISCGAFGSFATDALGFEDLFPGVTPYLATLSGHFMMPAVRELALGAGGVSSSAESLSYLMTKPGGGTATALIVGGAAESLRSTMGEYRILLRRRRGFVRLALQHGTPLVPVISFGETDLYDQLANPEGSWLRWAQDLFRMVTGIAPVVPIGRGWFQYNFGLAPRRHTITTVVGRPLEVEKVPEPTREQIESLHEKFTKHLNTLFEEEKHKYIQDADDVHLALE